jgi:hypothetical protein
MNDMGENPFANGNIKIMVAGQVIGLSQDAQLTISEETGLGSVKDCCDDTWRPSHIEKTWDIECSGLVAPDDDKLDNIFGKTPQEIAITFAQEPGKMPRKMKKAYRAAHQRETKWKRKAENYIKRKTYHAQHATIETTGNDGQTVSAEVRFDRLNRECDMYGNQTLRMSGMIENRTIKF